MEYDIINGFTVINGFAFTTILFPYNIHDAIVVKCKNRSDCEAPRFNAPYHTIEEYVDFIQKNKIQKALIILDDISFITQCPSLRFVKIVPSYQAGENFDYSPLYSMPEIKSVDCQNRYGTREQFISEIDYTKINGIISLSLSVNKGTLNYNKIESLKSLGVSDFKGANYDLNDLFCSKQLDMLYLVTCGVRSLNGIETSNNMKYLQLDYNRSLNDISALKNIKDTLKSLKIENCPKIKDFSVLNELENLEVLMLCGSNELPDLGFLKSMKKLKLFVLSMNVIDGDLSLCKEIPYVDLQKGRKHYNLRNSDLPKGKYKIDSENIEIWRR